jgi:iron complex transport system substrate-binding protein
MMRKLWISLLSVLIILFIGACAQEKDNADGANDDTEAVEDEDTNASDDDSADSALETEYPVTITDATGEEITFEKEPERIVSVSPSETEVLFALGLDDKIYGVSDYDDYPEAALEKPKMGGVVDPNEEALIAAEPDLLVGGGSMNLELAEKLRGLDLPLYKTEPTTIQEILDSILQMGVITNTQEAAEKLVAEMEADIQEIKDTVADIEEDDKKRVYVEFSPGWTVGKGEFMDEVITIAGGYNIASDTEGWNEINEEKIIQDDPEVIIYAADLVDADSDKELDELIKDRSGWDKITAIQEDQLIGIEQNLLNRLGPRVTEGLKQMAEGIYPDLF